MAKSAAAKSAAKKKNRKLKRQIRKTVGALLMVSAIAVAAVPVPDISANPADNTVIKVAVTDSRETTNDFNGATAGYESEIPLATDTTPIYTSGEGMYQFAYIDEVAVILQYNGGYLEGNSVVIPDTIEGYKKYTDNTTRNDFCLVTKDGSFLAYRTQEQKIDANQQRVYTVPTIIDQNTGEQLVVVQNQLVLDPNGSGDFVYRETVTVPNPDPSGSPSTEYKYHKVSPVMEWKYNPCYYADRDKEGGWGTLKDAQLYWENRSVTPFEYQPAGGTDSKQRINADVAYLGVQTVEKDPATGSWELGDYITDPADGVFAGESNIVSVQMSENIRGIGDYAFYNCRNLEKVILNNGLQSIGNGVFAGCINIVECNIDVTARIRVIGKDAFYGCAALKSFTVPVAIEALGDSCFEGCTGLESIDFSGGGKNLALEKLGYHLFQGCSSLGAVEFPSTYRENDIDIDMFKGCSSLQKVVIQNEYTTVGEFHDGTSPYPTCTYTWEDFLKDVPDSFYFEGPDPSAIHEAANENSAAFKYLGQDLYEKVMFEDEPAHDTHPGKESAKITYQVNSTGELVKFTIEEGCKPDNVTIPETIGAYGITAIKAGSFTGNCDLVRVTIPASVTSIGDNAFRGCHRLSTVIFTDATTMTSIGTDAFKTQEGVSCTEDLYDRDDPTGPEKPKLYFVGAMMDDAGQDTVPFMYAMNGSSNINNERQEKIWIICHSGWPTNLEVQYNRVTDDEPGESQLVGYPRYEMLENYVTEWVESLPYVTDKNKDEYIAMVQNATSGNNPTEMEMAVVRAALNVAIPNSVNSIKPGLFSGYSYYYDKDDTNHLYPLKARVDTEGKLYKDENGDGTSWVQITVNDKNELISGDGDGTPYPSDAAKQINTDEKIQSVTINGVDTIEPYTFAECPELLSADINGSKMLGDYAFDNCEKLATAKIGANLQDTGKRPFRGCGTLTQINCEESPVFSFDRSILYRSTGNGKEVVECLENRGLTSSGTPYNITADELSGVTSLKPEAFAECKKIESIDMSNTTVNIIPEGCFKEMELRSIIFPNTIGKIEKDAFVDNNVNRFTVDFKNSNPPVIAEDAFKPLEPDSQEVVFVCKDASDSNPNIYGNDQRYPYIITTEEGWSAEFTVTFVNLPDWPSKTNPEYITSQTVKAGSDAVPPTGEFKCKDEAYTFSGWSDYTNIQGDRTVETIYDTPKYTVIFQDGITGEQIGEAQKVTRGWAATPPADDLIPQHEGYMFVGWEPAPTSILKDTTCIAKYVQNDGNMHTVTYCAYDGTVLTSYKVAHEENAPNIQGPVRDGYTFTGWMPAAYLTKVTEDRTVVATYQQGGGGNAGPNPSGGNGNGNGNNPNPSGGNGNNGNNNNANSSSSPKNSATPTATPADGKDVPKYTVTVSGGSGTGSYPAGAVVAINAYAMGVGQVFDKWTSSTAGVGFADATATSTTFTMPAANVAITATYKTGGAGNAATNSSGGSGGGGGSSTGTVNNGSTVEVSKPGISNTNVAGATVTGATDNFVVKVSEDQAATDAATSALQARFGDLSRIKYFPMDISLYDSTGRTKIADTSGISVNLTLPLPDELIQYAGNNKMAAISGGALEDLNARFTTVGGVPCINFTATHFSPYVIYVDTANLTEATIDSTPKTGDPIHPKWFLAIGMACISLVLFFKRDKVVVKTKAA